MKPSLRREALAADTHIDFSTTAASGWEDVRAGGLYGNLLARRFAYHRDEDRKGKENSRKSQSSRHRNSQLSR
jgi:hypothetical protein